MIKKQPKIVVVKREKAKKFDLSFSKTAENIKIISAIESLKANDGWQFMVQMMTENINLLSKQIVEKNDGTTNFTDQEVDELRTKYFYMKEILEKPEKILKELMRTEGEAINFDPYN